MACSNTALSPSKFTFLLISTFTRDRVLLISVWRYKTRKPSYYIPHDINNAIIVAHVGAKIYLHKTSTNNMIYNINLSHPNQSGATTAELSLLAYSAPYNSFIISSRICLKYRPCMKEHHNVTHIRANYQLHHFIINWVRYQNSY